VGPSARYDGVVDWYETFRPELGAVETDVLERHLGRGPGRCLDLGCGTGVAIATLQRLGWTVAGVDVSEKMLARARERGAEVVRAAGDALPFADGSFDAVVSIWTHTDVDDFPAVVREAARVLRGDGPLVYIGAHPCFVGPHSRFIAAQGVPELHAGYRDTGRYDDGPAIGPDGLRARVGATHLPLGLFLGAFLDAGFRIERFEELDADASSYPFRIALRARR
jgi:SAM-dependent methyltransferase